MSKQRALRVMVVGAAALLLAGCLHLERSSVATDGLDAPAVRAAVLSAKPDVVIDEMTDLAAVPKTRVDSKLYRRLNSKPQGVLPCCAWSEEGVPSAGRSALRPRPRCGGQARSLSRLHSLRPEEAIRK